MPRKRLIPKKKLQPDPIYNSVSVTRFTNMIMSDGKKRTAEKEAAEAELAAQIAEIEEAKATPSKNKKRKAKRKRRQSREAEAEEQSDEEEILLQPTKKAKSK